MNQSTLEFLSTLRTLGVRLSCDGDRLRCNAPAGVVTGALRVELATRKQEILSFLGEASLATLPDPIKPVSREGKLLLSFAQKRLWVLSRLEPENFAYNIPSYFRLQGRLNVQVLESSLNEIVRRHEVLRTCYSYVEGQPALKIKPAESLPLPLIDLQALPEAAQWNEAVRLAHSDSIQPFDLGRSPMLRVLLLKLAPESHIFLLNVHHIAFDGWSFGVLTKELSAIYTAYVRGQPSPLPELGIQYADFATWQQQQLQRDTLKSQLAYWQKQLSGSLNVLDLPTDRPRPARQTANGGSVFFNLSRSTTDDLKSLSQREEVTLFVTLLAAFGTLLMRHSGQEEILVGTPISNRNRTEIEELIGFFVNTLVMRTDLSGDPAFRTLMRRVQDVAVNAYAHQDVPFEKLVEALKPERDVSRSPIFQVMFSLEHSPVTPLELPGLEPTWVEIQSSGAQFDLSLYLTETNHSIVGRFSFNSDLFDHATIARMAEQFQILLAEVIRNSEQRLHEVPLLTARDRDDLLAWNRTGDDYSSTLGIHELFEIHAQRAPNAVAVECGGERLTYRELNDRSDRLAQHLQTLGVGAGAFVGVCVDRSVGMAVALLGILKAGASYLPLDLAFPRERLTFMLDEAKPHALVTETDLLDKLPSHSSAVVCLDHFSWTTERSPVKRPDRLGRAYLLYTSGSTGQPKGVEVSHRAVVNFLHSMRATPGMDENDILLSVTTFSFDIFGLELWLPLTTGAKVVIARGETCKDGRLLARAIASSGATVMQATPTTWRMLLQSGWQGNPRMKLLCGGEAWSKDLAASLLPKCGSLWNMYGPTETTIWSAVYRIGADAEVRVGPPIANTQFYVVDSHLRLQPMGVPGELLIGGDGLADGYLNRPELTAEKFIANPVDGGPFDKDPDSRLYRTGDLVRRLPGDTIEFLSRLDHQVKLRGFRIELGEIENFLQTHASVKEAVVVLSKDDEPRLVAYCVLAKESEVTAAGLRQLLRSKLPEYMIPSELVFLPDLPLTPNGKVDRKALLAMPRAPREAKTAATEPRDHLERQLTALWEKVLNVRPVHSSDNFFDLGGHSFAAVQLLSEIHKLTGKNLPLATLFQAATVESLAEILRKDDAPSWSILVPINPRGSKPPLFLVHGAEGNLLLYRQLVGHLGSEQPVYGLQSQGLNGDQALADSVEEMASSYIREIVAIQPEGPYLVGGYCLGGLIAFEMAQQLTAAGKEVGLVVMLETYNPNAVSPAQNRFALLHRLQNAWFHSANLAMIPNTERRKFLREKLDIARIRVGIRLRALAYRFQNADLKKIHSIYPHLLVTQVNDRAASRYLPTPYRGRVALIRPKRFFAGLDGLTLGWNGLIRGGLEVHEVPVNPRGMLVEPFCRTLADLVRKCLDGVAVAQMVQK